MKNIIAFFLFFIFSIKAEKNFHFKGVTFTSGKYCPNVTLDSDDAKYSLRQLKATGANYIALIVIKSD